MRTRKLYPFFICMLITVSLITQVTAQDTANHGTETPSPTDYFNRVTLFSHGKITRFTQMPIQVHISPTLKALPYLAEIRYAMRTWETATDGVIRFEETEVAAEANIRVTATTTGTLKFLDTRLGSAKLTRTTQDIHTVIGKDAKEQHKPAPPNTEVNFTVEVILALESNGTIGELSQEEMRTVCLHEFGHAIGLWGHSPHSLDVCHATATAQHPTARDINTLRKLYNTPLYKSQHETAIALLKKEIQAHEKHEARQARPHYLLGTVYFDKGDMAQAIASFENCLAIEANFEPAREKLIQAYEKTDQLSQAIRLVQQTVVRQRGHRSFRENADAYNLLGTFHYRQGEVDKAIQAFEDALKRAPHHKLAKQNLHRLFLTKAFDVLKANAFEEATTYFEKAISLDPLNATAYRLMGDRCTKASRFAAAIQYYRKGLEIAPEDEKTTKNLLRCYNNYGVALRNSGEWDAAIRAYRNALELDPTYQLGKNNLRDALWQKANAQREAGRSAEAIATYLELQTLQPDDMNISGLLGVLYLRTRNYPAAVAAFQRIYTAMPTDKQAQHNLLAAYQQYAQALRNQKNYTAAVTQLQKAVSLFPTDINLRLSLSQAYQHIGKYEAARNELQQILAHAPNNQNAKTELLNLQIRRGSALMRRKKYAAAAAVFEAIPASQKTVDIYNMLGYLYLIQAEHMKALAIFETVLGKQPKNAVAYQNLISLESRLAATVDKAKTAAQPDTSAPDATADKAAVMPDATTEKLSRVRCGLARCLMDRKQPKNAMEKYRQALQAKPYTPALQTHLVDTGRKLAIQLRKRNDTDNLETIIRWATALDSNFKTSLEP